MRVLRTGGKIILNVPFYYCRHEQPHDYYRFTEFALKRFAQLTGLEILVLKPTGGAPEILADILAKNLEGKTRLGKYGAVLVQFLCRRFIDTRMGERVSASTAQRFPLGTLWRCRKDDYGERFFAGVCPGLRLASDSPY